jgi:hypothetical protein
MKKCFLAFLLLLIAIPAFGQDVGPNQVIIFEHNDFVGKSVSFTLEPGMRQKLVPKLLNFNDKVSSILVGKNVKVMVFKHVDFKGKYRVFRTVNRLSEFKEFDALFQQGDMNDWISSMIIFPSTRYTPAGVVLEHDTWDWGDRTKIGDNFRAQYFPLSENKTEDKAKFSDLTDYMNDQAEYIRLNGNVVVTVYEHNDFKGSSLKFPGEGPSQDKSYYKLETYQFKDKISSLIVQGVGDEVLKMGTLKVTTTPHRAPEKKESDTKPTMVPHKAKVITPQKAPEMKGTDTGPDTTQQMGEAIIEPRFDLFEKLEEDMDRPGNNYQNFDIPHPDPKICLIDCQNDPRCKAFTYVKPGLQGPKARCWLKDAVPAAKPSPGCISGVKK